MVLITILLVNFTKEEIEQLTYLDCVQTDFTSTITCTIDQFITMQNFIDSTFHKPLFVQFEIDTTEIGGLVEFLF